MNRIHCFCLLVVLLASGVSEGNGAETRTIPIPDACPPKGPDGMRGTADDPAPSGDGNGDSIPDWKLSEVVDNTGNKLTLWCIDQNPSTRGDEFYALVKDGKFIGKCAYSKGKNNGSYESTGDTSPEDGKPDKITKITWTTSEGDARGFTDDNRDGMENRYVYTYNPSTGNVTVVKQSHDPAYPRDAGWTTNSNVTVRPKPVPFTFADLPPENAEQDDPDCEAEVLTVGGFAFSANGGTSVFNMIMVSVFLAATATVVYTLIFRRNRQTPQ